MQRHNESYCKEVGYLMIHSIEATGMTGAFAYRYQYQTQAHHYFGYCETLEEAQATLREFGAI
jgi:hypothetical protein